MSEDDIAKGVVDAAFRVHKKLGPGLLERVYEACLCHELAKAGFQIARQVPIPITYDDLIFDEGFRLDILVEDSVIIELKASDKVHPYWQAQILSYLRLAKKKLVFLINFNTPLFKDGVQRFIV